MRLPRVLDFLTPKAFKNVSATCRSVRSLFCAQVNIICLPDLAHVAVLCLATWRQLMMVVCTSRLNDQLLGKLSDEWEYMMEMQSAWGTAVLIRSRQQVHSPVKDLPSQPCAALSRFAKKSRQPTICIMLGSSCGLLDYANPGAWLLAIMMAEEFGCG